MDKILVWEDQDANPDRKLRQSELSNSRKPQVDSRFNASDIRS